MGPVPIRPHAARPGRNARAVLGHARRFARDDTGAVSVEAVLWLPLLFGFLMLVTDVSMAFYGKAQAFRTIQDANRALSVRRIADTDAVVAMVEEAYQSYAPGAEAQSAVMSGMVVTQLTIPMRDLVVFTTLGGWIDTDITVQSMHFLE